MPPSFFFFLIDPFHPTLLQHPPEAFTVLLSVSIGHMNANMFFD